MIRRNLLLAVAATIGVLASLAVAEPVRAAEAQPVEVVDVDLRAHPEVKLVVAGSALAGPELTSDAFTLREGGRDLPVVATRLATDDLEIVLTIDASGSMAGPAMPAARAAAARFLDALPPDTRVSVVAFGAQPSVVLPFTADRAAQHAAVAGLTPQGETALYDALVTSGRLFGPAPTGRRAVVLLSDGGDTASTHDLEAALAALGAAGAQVWTVSLLTTESDSAALERISARTDGAVIGATNGTALHEAYRTIAASLTGRYELRFRSEGHGSADLEVTATVGGSTYRAATPVVYPAAPSSPPPPQAEPPERPSTHGLVAGAAAFFAALLVLGLVLLVPRPGHVRLTRLGGRGADRASSPLADLAVRVTAATERKLERSQRRRGLDSALELAGVSLRAAELVILVATATFVAAAVGWLLLGALGAIVLGAVGLLLPKVVLVVLRDRRRARFADQLDEVLQLLAGSLRAGYGLLQAVEGCARESEAPAADELRRITTEVALGRDLVESLQGMADRLDSEDFGWVVQAIQIHREVGGDLAEVLDRVSETIRARNQLRRQVAALSAEGKLSGIILFLLPIGLLAVMAVMNPAYISELGSSAGFVVLTAAGMLLVTGGFWIRRLVRIVY